MDKATLSVCKNNKIKKYYYKKIKTIRNGKVKVIAENTYVESILAFDLALLFLFLSLYTFFHHLF